MLFEERRGGLPGWLRFLEWNQTPVREDDDRAKLKAYFLQCHQHVTQWVERCFGELVASGSRISHLLDKETVLPIKRAHRVNTKQPDFHMSKIDVGAMKLL